MKRDGVSMMIDSKNVTMVLSSTHQKQPASIACITADKPAAGFPAQQQR